MPTRLVDRFASESRVAEGFVGDRPVAAPFVWAVGSLVQAIADTLAQRFNPVAVRGEISGFSRAASGHCYFSLKDEAGQIRCAMFRRHAEALRFSPRDGMRVRALGRLDVYGARGDLQLVVESLTPAGEGALFEQFLQLKAQLEAQGLFDAARKRALPSQPRSIAVVTSLGAAALRDVVTALRRRVPHVPVVIHPASVQGAQAPAELCAALQTAYGRWRTQAEGDVLLLVRGGGSLEDLWAFNDETVVRTVAQAPMPVVCGVGHETDFTLADFVADLRAPTPTAAAELCAPARDAVLADLQQRESELQEAVWRSLDARSQRLDRLARRLGFSSSRLRQEHDRLASLAHRIDAALRLRLGREVMGLDRARQRLQQSVERTSAIRRERLERCAAALPLLDPKLVLRRGFAFLTDGQGRGVTSVHSVSAGDALQATLADGVLDLTVRR